MSRRKLGSLGPDFDEFVRQSATPLLRTAVLLVGDYATAEDLVQTAFIRTAGRWSAAREAPGSYVRRVLVNLVKDTKRDRARRPEWPADMSLLPEREVRNDLDVLLDRDQLLQALDHLSRLQRATIVLRFFEDLPVDEVALVLNLTESTVRSHTRRGLARMRAAIGNDRTRPEDIHVR